MDNFNLVDQPWIPVRMLDGSDQLISLQNVILQSHEIAEIAGKSETQTFAILRLLESILIASFYRFDLDGRQSEEVSEKVLVKKWSEVWRKGQIPQEFVEPYFEQQHSHFELLGDGERFMQAHEALARKGTFYSSAKLIGTIAESNNKRRLFQQRNGIEKEQLDPAEAVSWLLHLINYDDASSKKTAQYKSEIPADEQVSVGVGWLGKIGGVYASGRNLFQTLMYNCVLLRNGETVWDSARASWEIDAQVIEREKIAMPNDLAYWLTAPFRYPWLLVNQAGKIYGLNVIGGKFIDSLNADIEQFTLWTQKSGSGETTDYYPRTHKADRELWRDFQSILQIDEESSTKLPGLVKWLSYLQNDEDELLDPDLQIEFRAPFAEYDSKNCSFTELSGHSLTVYSSLMTSAGDLWKQAIQQEIEKIDKLAQAAGFFERNVFLASGGNLTGASNVKERGIRSIYSRVNQPFTSWIAKLNPNAADEYGEADLNLLNEWTGQAYLIAKSFEQDVIRKAPSSAWMGRLVEREKESARKKTGEGKKEEKQLMAIPIASMIFNKKIRELYPAALSEQKEEDKSDGANDD